MQLEILHGITPVPCDLGTCILAGSKRLLIEHGMFGNNLDVLGTDESVRLSSTGGVGDDSVSSGGGEPSVDLVIFEDGTYAGPDTDGVRGALEKSLAMQRSTVQGALEAIRAGASPGELFEILRPLAERDRSAPLSSMFGRIGIKLLTQSDPTKLTEWLETFERGCSVAFRRVG